MFSSGLHNRCEEWKVWALKSYVNSTSWMTVIVATDRPKSVCHPCVINAFVASLRHIHYALSFVYFVFVSYECVGYLPVSLYIKLLV